MKIDTLYRRIKELVPLTDGPSEGGVRGPDLARADSLENAAIAVRGGRIVETGPDAELAKKYDAEDEVDLTGSVVLPGLVDCHTHPVFAATREMEFSLRCKGADYVEIAKKGGGILSSVKAVRASTQDELVRLLFDRMLVFLSLGTTTVEAKSGYGLSTDAELMSLRALERVALLLPITVHPTFLGAHEIAPEYREDPGAYVELLIDEMLPAARELATSCDAFIEAHVFDLAQGRRILTRAKELGYRLRVHVDELSPLGGTELAVQLGAASADHLLRISDIGIEQLAASQTTGVLLPGTSFFLGKDHAPARRIIDAGALVALATDFNPGTCYTQSLPMIATLARLQYGMSQQECLNAMTRNAANSLGVSKDIGTLHNGKAADFVALDLPSFEAFGYGFGGNPVVMTVKDGIAVVTNLLETTEEVAKNLEALS